MKGGSVLTAAAKRLQGKVSIITGGASGIGATTARLFARYGAKVVIADIQDDLGELVSNESKDIEFIHCDVTKENDVKFTVDKTLQSYGKLDIMFSNAGIAGRGTGSTISTAEKDDFLNVFKVNTYGGFLCAKHAARVMTPVKKGSIIFTSSVASVIQGETSHAYTTSKHGLVGLAKNLCVELGQYGIRVNCISPHGVVTPLLIEATGLDPSTAEEVLHEAANLKGVVLKTEDVAEAAVYLGSDESRYISGHNLVVDGGYSATNVSAKMAMSAYRNGQL